jgi:PPOX class probable F420-dependent enzyme
MPEMSQREIRRFLMNGTYTAKLATVKKDGSSHVVPIWFVLDRSKKSARLFDIVFTTGSTSVKAKNIQRDNRVSICIDDQIPLYSFVMISGIAKIQQNDHNKLFKFARQIARRYMEKNKAEEYGKRNSTKGEVLVRIKPKKIIGAKDIAGWD